MSKRATPIVVSDEDRATLVRWVRATTTEQRLAIRASIVLAAAEGKSTAAIAQALGVRTATVSKWRVRFAGKGLEGLQDEERPGARPRYGPEVERRILAMLDEPAPAGYATWNGSLLASALGDVSEDQVWRVLRRHGIQLQRRRRWCISNDPEFAVKAAAIVGLYPSPPENAVVICVDEKPSIQALERAQGWLRLPDGRALTGVSHEYKRHGTTTLFGALEVATGRVRADHYKRKRRREFLDFMNGLVSGYDRDQEIHVILDNLSTHRPKTDRWRAKHGNVHFHYTPTHASWLNQIEVWFSIMWRGALRGASFTSPRQVRQAIDAFIQMYNTNATPFEWTKETVHPSAPKRKYADLCN